MERDDDDILIGDIGCGEGGSGDATEDDTEMAVAITMVMAERVEKMAMLDQLLAIE